MNQYIKSLLIRYIKNLKKNWLLGVVCLVVAIIFVIGSSKGNELANYTDFVDQSPTLVGVHSVSKISWDFDDNSQLDENQLVYETKVANAKETLQLLVSLTKSANFRIEINEQLVELGQAELDATDYFGVTTTGFDGVEIKVVGYDSNRVKVLEELVRKNFEATLKEHYGALAMDVVSQPIVLLAAVSVEGEGYTLLNQVYVENNNVSSNENNLGTSAGGNSLFTFKNIVIIFSAFILWMAIVLLITIADSRIYVEKDIVNSDLVCYGKIEKDKDKNECIYSVINRKLELLKVKKIHLIIMNKDRMSIADSVIKGIQDSNLVELEVSHWGKEVVDVLNKDEYTMLLISCGSCTNEDIDKCLKMLQVVEVNNWGCILY